MAVIVKNQILAPFLSTKLNYITGQDPMGMLNIGEQVFTMLLPGLNNITERIRYYSFYCWFFGWYAKDIGSEDPKDLNKYIRRAEYLLALIAAKSNASGIAGITEAAKNYNETALSFSLSEGTGERKVNFENTYWKNSRGVFGTNYVNSLKIIGLIRDQKKDSKLYIRTAFKKENVVTGKDLENAFKENLKQDTQNTFIKAITKGSVSQEELELLQDSFNMKAVPLPSEENNLLQQMLVGYDLPLSDTPTFFRKNTSQLYLKLLKNKQGKLSEQEFVMHAYQQQGLLKTEEDETLTAWYYYQLSQYWHIVNTGCLKHILNALQEKSDGSWYVENRLIEEVSYEVLDNLSLNFNVKDNAPFTNLPLLKDDNNTITSSVNNYNYIDGISYALLLLKKIISENESQIARLVNFAKMHHLKSSSDFVTVFEHLKILENLPLNEFIPKYLKKYIIDRHQLVSFHKVRGSQTSEKFIREDGLIRFIDTINFGFSGPRINTLIDFYIEIGVISTDGETLTKHGASFLKDLEQDD